MSYFTDIKYSIRIAYVFVLLHSAMLINVSSVSSNYRNFSLSVIIQYRRDSLTI
jgi:hypothetical protein